MLYESPRRVNRILDELAQHLGDEREAAVCRELTKRFEEVWQGSLRDLARRAAADPPRGEVVIVIGRGTPAPVDAAAMEGALAEALEKMSLKDAVTAVAAELGLPRRQVYQAALAREKGR